MITVTEQNGVLNIQGATSSLAERHASMSVIILGLLGSIYDDLQKYDATTMTAEEAMNRIVYSILESAVEEGYITKGEVNDKRINKNTK